LVVASVHLLAMDAAYALDPNRALSQYLHDRWGTEQGFPRGPVYAINQSSDGYLWIGTESGLVRFDGLNFQMIRDTSGFLHVPSVLGLSSDREGNMWVRVEGPVEGPRPLLYRDGTFKDPIGERKLPFSNVTAMGLTNQGTVLFSSLERDAVTYRNDRFETIAHTPTQSRSPWLSIAQTSDGVIWMGTRDRGLFRLFGGRYEVVNGLPDTKINCLLAVQNTLWIGTDTGVALWNGTMLSSTGIPDKDNRFQALALAKDRDGNIWVGTDSSGLLRLNSHGLSSADVGGRGYKRAITAVFEDREGDLWVGSADSIERYRDGEFVTYSSKEGLPSDSNGPVYVDESGRSWFAPVAGGLCWLEGARHGCVTEAGLGTDIVYSIAGRKDELWLGRQRGGLTRLQWREGGYRASTYTQTQGLSQNSVYSVYVTHDGTVWAGTLSGGVSEFKDGRFTTYTTANGLASNMVASMLKGSDGTMWFATPEGLSALSNQRWHTILAKEGLPSANVNSLFEDSAGVLWIGTARGLAFRDSGRIQTLKNEPVPLQEQILGIAEDKTGSLWFETSSHVLQVNRRKLMSGGLAEGDVREYGLADGLHGTEGVKRQRSVTADALGRIWFSLNRGLSVVDPARLSRNSVPPIVHVQAISVDRTNINLSSSVRIPAQPQRITFEFAGLGLAIPERVRFRYRLDGYDQKWSEPVAAREAVYTNLPPGPYRFRVAASNPDGAWNSAEASLPFEIDPLFWQTWPFVFSFVLSLGLVILALYRFRMHRLTRQLQVRFEERLAERTRIARELHDTLLQGFLSASMQLHVAADQLPPDSPVRPRLSRVLELVGQVIEEGRNAVRGLRSSRSVSLDLEQAFSGIEQELGFHGKAEFSLIVDGKPRPLRPILRDEVYRIGREALVNAFRHSQAKNIELEIEYAAKSLRMLVRDNGRGIDPRVLQSGREGHWGIQGMRERAEKIGAKLRVLSSAHAGTEIELSIPSHLAFEKNRRRL
jgi:signal transduction histidine kinase/ligand-binding sensor domain-containing protein